MVEKLLNVADNIGVQIENAIRQKILSNIPPPNSLATVRAKGSSHTLIDSGTMLDTISSKVESNENIISITVGLLEEDNIAEYACYNEYGTNHIPERSFIRSTYDEIFDSKLMPEIADNMQNLALDKLKGK